MGKIDSLVQKAQGLNIRLEILPKDAPVNWRSDFNDDQEVVSVRLGTRRQMKARFNRASKALEVTKKHPAQPRSEEQRGTRKVRGNTNSFFE